MKEETKIRYCPNCGTHGPKTHEHPYGSQECMFVCPECPDKAWREWPDKDCVKTDSGAIIRWAESGEELTDDEVAEYYRTTMKDDVSEEERLFCLNHYLKRTKELKSKFSEFPELLD